VDELVRRTAPEWAADGSRLRRRVPRDAIPVVVVHVVLTAEVEGASISAPAHRDLNQQRPRWAAIRR